ncbi:MAG: RiPP maturation radical SAM protein 1 [Chloroflexi bacterium]|nr:RiPP maturation radical SAM protein 1 [Chloroflexota bacterium]
MKTFDALSPTEPVSRETKSVDVLLVSMPFAPLLQPSIGLSLLKAGLTRLDVASEVLYLTLRFAEEIGIEAYTKISNAYQGTILGEWIFAHTLFQQTHEDVQSYIEQVILGDLDIYRYMKSANEDFVEEVLRVREKAEAFLDLCLEIISAYRFSIIGFTSVFHQHVASLSLAKRIKKRFPERYIVFGGANCEGVMGVETLQQFKFVDAVVSGEGDLVFPQLVEEALAGRWHNVGDLEGVYVRDSKRIFGVNGGYPNAPKPQSLDALPYPDYSDYFLQYEEAAFDKPEKGGRILFETSRGCWWGDKHHCTFCGLNGSSLTYRSKSPDRALRELESLLEKYPGWSISVVDNILDMGYFNNFIPELASRNRDIELFYEVKANLQKHHVRLLKEAGITSIQPGIESLSTPVLRLMRKGVSALQNIQLLKWCKEFGVRPYWNILWGFPGEPEEEYRRMTELVPLITHLPPPKNVGPMHLQRFSPNFDYADAFGFKDVQPFPAYYHVYEGLPKEAIAHMAYYFTFSYKEKRDVDAYTAPFAQALEEWQEDYVNCDLFSVDKGDVLIVCDLRLRSQQPLIYLRGVAKEVYQACDKIHSIRQLYKIGQYEPGQIEPILEGLVSLGLMLEENGKYLSLAIPLGVYSLSKPILQRFREILSSTARKLDGKYILKVETPDMPLKDSTLSLIR